jgi:hypothetical protein
MLFISLILSGVLLLAVNWAAWKKIRGLAPLSLLGGLFFLCQVSFVVGLQSLLLFITWLGWKGSGKQAPVFAWLSVVATAAAYGFVGWFVWREERHLGRLREEYAFTSMEERLPAPRATLRAGHLPKTAETNLAKIEEGTAERGIRTMLLDRLHQSTVTRFVESPGFGLARSIRPSPEWLTQEEQAWREPPVDNPGKQVPVEGSPGDLEKESFTGDRTPLDKLHVDSVVKFVFPDGFGLVKDRRNVAGFLSHRFTEAPSSRTLRVEAIDLVSLLLHDQPVAYVSKHLPQMKELRSKNAPTRPLDTFESVGLVQLEGGEDLYVYSKGNTIRMLGSLRAGKQCVTCHGCERGDLLGAFSYTLEIQKK